MTGGDSSARDAGRDAGEHAEEAARRASPWVERMARFGYAAKGVVYAVMGVLAVLAAVIRGRGEHDRPERCLSDYRGGAVRAGAARRGRRRADGIRALAFYTGRRGPRRGGPGAEGGPQTDWLRRKRPS